MESDLSLIEISGEDDSLLQQIPSDDMRNNYFSCSPLQIPRSKRSADSSRISRLEGIKGNEHAEKLSFSSPNKENTNENKSQVLKLGEEPHQMKRRKKGGGYNLRKSLAWNKAFFTEEGVLDPLELSMISGTFNMSSGNVLSVIHEEGIKSLSGDSDCASDSVDLQAVEEKSFKGLPASTPNKGKRTGGGVSPKHDSSALANGAPASGAKRKVLSAHDVNRSGSKRSGCPRPLASSSQKKPANANTTKSTMKESKLPKVMVSKPETGLLPVTTKCDKLGASCSYRNQIARQVNVQKSTGLKGSSDNTRSAQNKAKAGPDCKSLSSKSSVQPTRRNVASSLLEISSSSNLRPPLGGKSSGGFEVVPDPVLPTIGIQSSNCRAKSSKISVSLPQNAESTGGNMPHVYVQAPKPSGLRMPSPSLGFFGQPKALVSQSLLQRSTQPCKIPNLRKLGATNPVRELRPPRAPGKMLKVVNEVTPTGNIRGLNSSRECSVPSAVNSGLHENMKLNLDVNNLQKVEVKAPNEPEGSETINNQRQLRSIIDGVDKQFEEHAEPHKVEKISCDVGTELQMIDNKLLLRSGSLEQLNKDSNNKMAADVCSKSRDSSGDESGNPHFTSEFSPVVQVSVSQTKSMVEHQQIEDKQCNLSLEDHNVLSASQSGDAISYSNQEMHDDWLRSTHDVNEQSGEQAELIKPCFCDADQVLHDKGQRLQTNGGILPQESRSSEKSLKHAFADASLKVQGRSGSEERGSHDPLQLEYIEQPNEYAVGVGVMTLKSPVADAQMQSSDCNALVENCNSNLSTSAMHNQCLKVDGANERSGEQPELQIPCLVQGVSQDHHELHSFCGTKLENSHFMSQPSPAVQLEGALGTNDLIKQHVEGNQYNLSVQHHGAISESEFGDVISYNQSTLIVHNNWVSDMHDVNEQSGEQSELIKPGTCEADQVFCEDKQKILANDGILGEESRSIEEFQKYDTESIADVRPKVRVSSRSEWQSSRGSSQLQYTDQANEGAAGVCNVTKKSHVEVAQVQSLDDNLFVEGCNSNLTALAVSGGSKLESSSGSFQLKCSSQANETAAGVHKTTGKSHVADAQVHDNLLGEDCNNNLTTSEVYNKCLMVVDDANTQSGEHLELRSPSSSSEDFRDENVIQTSEFVASEQNHACGSESKSLGVLSWALPAIHCSDGVDVNKKAEHPQVSSSVEINLLVEHRTDSIETQLRHDIELNGQATLEYDSLLKMGEGQTIEVLKSNILPGEVESKSCANDPYEENQRLRNNGISFVESRSFEDSQKDNSGHIADVSLKVRGSGGSELESYHSPSQPKYIEQRNEGSSGVDSMTEKSHSGDAQMQSLVHNVVTESCNRNLNSSEKHNHYVMVGNDVSEQSGEPPEKLSKAFCSLSEESGLLDQSVQPSSDQSILQGVGINELKSETLPEEAEIRISADSEGPKGEVQHELESAVSPSKDKDTTMPIRKSGDDVKQDALLIKPPPNAVPFSDEWLAAIEAAGEDILTLKTGAVQHSPPDKSIPEPSPWSPVKRKNNQVGPFDCTKHTNSH